jgi:hypothetical protein
VNQGFLNPAICRKIVINKKNICYIFIYQSLSFGITLATGRRQTRHVRRAFTHKRITRSMRTTKRITAPRASPRVAPCAGPCAAPFHTWWVARGPAGCCCTLWSPYLRGPLCDLAPAATTLLIPPAPTVAHGDRGRGRGGTLRTLSVAERKEGVPERDRDCTYQVLAVTPGVVHRVCRLEPGPGLAQPEAVSWVGDGADGSPGLLAESAGRRHDERVEGRACAARCFSLSLVYMTDRIQKWRIHLNPVKSLVHHQARMTLSFPTVPSAPPPSESEKCRFNNVNCSHLTAHSFGVESQARARSR